MLTKFIVVMDISKARYYIFLGTKFPCSLYKKVILHGLGKLVIQLVEVKNKNWKIVSVVKLIFVEDIFFFFFNLFSKNWKQKVWTLV